MPRFRTTIQSVSPENTMTFIEVPAKVMAQLGPRKRVPVRVTINGYTYRSTNSVCDGISSLPVRAAVRAAAGVEAGDRVTVDVEVDSDSRAVEPPPDLAKALRAAGLLAGYGRLAPTHQKEYVQWLEAAKRPETHTGRVTKIVEAVREKAAR